MKKILSLFGVLLLVPALVLGAVMIISSQPVREDSARTQFILGNAYFLQNDFGTAISHFESAVAIRPDYEEALKNLALSYNKVSRFSDAAAILRLLVELHPENAEYHYDLGVNVVMTLQEDNSGTIEELEEALSQIKQAEELRPGIEHAKENIVFLEGLRSQYFKDAARQVGQD